MTSFCHKIGLIIVEFLPLKTECERQLQGGQHLLHDRLHRGSPHPPGKHGPQSWPLWWFLPLRLWGVRKKGKDLRYKFYPSWIIFIIVPFIFSSFLNCTEKPPSGKHYFIFKPVLSRSLFQPRYNSTINLIIAMCLARLTNLLIF